MQSFKQYITEKPIKLSGTLPYKGSKWEDFRGLENPNEREIVTFLNKSKFKSLRFLVDTKGKMWVWDANHGLHAAVVYAMTGKKLSGDYALGTFSYSNIQKKDGNIAFAVLNTRAVGKNFALKNKTIKSLAKRINSKGDKQVYYNDDVLTG